MSQPYFVDHKRGEIDELRASLQNFKIKDKRDTIKKVIAYVSLGIDMSKLFSEMIMAASTTDAVQKKMVYSYLCTYAQEKADLAILCINTLQKDCHDRDPMFRGLALRSLCSLRVPSICEYALPALRQGLKDVSPYVRKTSVLAAAKLYSFQREAVEDGFPELVDILYEMLRDSDTAVITNVVLALNEILQTADECSEDETNHLENHETDLDYFKIGVSAKTVRAKAGMDLTSNIMLYLFNRLHDFPEWGQCAVLQLACRYNPQSEDEMFDVMNLLEDKLKHANSAVVMATIKVFLHLTATHPEIQLDVFHRLESPLITLMAVSPVEVSYAVLVHIKAIAQHSPSVFSSSYKQLFVRHNDPWCIKQEKMTILTIIANADNALHILSELVEYVNDPDPDLASFAVSSIGKTAVNCPRILDDAVNILLEMNQFHQDHLTSEVIVACRDILRKYPDRHVDVVHHLQHILQSRDIYEIGHTSTLSSGSSSVFVTPSNKPGNSRAVCAILWMIGEFGEDLLDAPYVLEDVVNTWSKAEEDNFVLQDSDVQLELISAAVKLFFKRPPEVIDLLGRLFTIALGDGVDVVVREKALLYYRMLSANVGEANKVVNANKTIVETFWEDALALNKHDNGNGVATSYMLREFDSLSVVYGIPQSSFKPLSATLIEEEPVVEPGYDEHVEHDMPSESISPTHEDSYNPDIITEAHTEDESGLGLQLHPEIDQDTYQMLWGDLPEIPIEFGIDPARAGDASVVETCLAASRIYVMAAGDAEGVAKYYLYAANLSDEDTSDGNPAVYLIECNIESATGAVSAVLKTNKTEDHANAMYNLFGTTLSSL